MDSQPCVLVFAGLDPSGGAGILADAEAIRAAGARPLCVATALTAQTSKHALSFVAVGPQFVVDSGRALLAEENVRAIKLGMLGTTAMAQAICALLDDPLMVHKLPVVIDPVLAASSGPMLFRGTEDEARAVYAALARGRIITPNAAEAQLLLKRAKPVDRLAAQEDAARAFVAAGARAALVKGGHVEGGSESVDVLVEGKQLMQLRGQRFPGTARGTGCRLASTLAAGLALGQPLEHAARVAKEKVARYLRG